MISFSYNGISGDTYGCYLTDRPEIKTAKMDSQTEAVPGRGEITLINGGHADVSVDIGAYVRNSANVDNVIRWLTADGAYHPLIFSYDATRCRYARVDGEIVTEYVSRSMSARQLEVPMRMKPYWYQTLPETITTSAGDIVLANQGNIEAAPTITVTGTGDVTITCGGKEFDITDMPASITIDFDAKTAYTTDGTTYTLATGYTSGDWLTIPTGESVMTITGEGVTAVTVLPRWRWL